MFIFAAGFAAGWLGRSVVDPSKSVTVQIVAFGMDTLARIKRAVAVERERFEDLVAEAQDAVARKRAERAERAEERADGVASAAEHAA